MLRNSKLEISDGENVTTMSYSDAKTTMREDTPSWFRSMALKLKETNIKIIIGLKIPPG